jgi:hypothetical protein
MSVISREWHAGGDVDGRLCTDRQTNLGTYLYNFITLKDSTYPYITPTDIVLLSPNDRYNCRNWSGVRLAQVRVEVYALGSGMHHSILRILLPEDSGNVTPASEAWYVYAQNVHRSTVKSKLHFSPHWHCYASSHNLTATCRHMKHGHDPHQPQSTRDAFLNQINFARSNVIHPITYRLHVYINSHIVIDSLCSASVVCTCRFLRYYINYCIASQSITLYCHPIAR